MKTSRKNIYVFLPIFAAALVIGGCKGGAKQAGPPPGGPVEVEVVTLAPQTISLNTELPGRTAAFRIAEVRPQVSGIILKRQFEEGSEVKAGQVLYQIDPALYRAAHDSAKAAQARAEAMENSTRLKAERYRKLVDGKAVSVQDQVETEAAWKQAQAEVAAAKAAVESTRINLAYTEVKSPISGRIGKSSVTEGALVTAQQAMALATVQQLDPMYIDVSQPSVELQRLKNEAASGQLMMDQAGKAKVTVLLEDGSAYREPGMLEFADVTVNETTGTVTLRALVANPRQELLPGMFVRARLDKGQRKDAILVPQAGVSRDLKGGAQVMVVNGESMVELRKIVTSQVIDGKALIESGLAAGDRVIVAGLQKVRPGAPVKIADPAAAGQAAGQPGGQAGPKADAAK